MKTCLSMLLLTAALAANAQDGATIYKSKCASCHGPQGAGRSAMKGTNLLSPEAKKATDDAMLDTIQNGGASKKAAHAFGKKGVTADQAKTLVAYIRELQK